MDDLMRLLDEAKAAGLVLWPAGDKLMIRGPRSAAPVVRRLAARKADILRGLRTGMLPRERLAFNFRDDVLALGDIAAGWTPADWRDRLRYLARRCARYRPDLADYYRRWADDIDARLPKHDAPTVEVTSADNRCSIPEARQ